MSDGAGGDGAGGDSGGVAGGVDFEVSSQVPPFAPAYPASHIHALDAVLPAGEFEFKGQTVQTPLPSTGLYVPATQALQEPLPAADLYFPTGQAVHDADASTVDPPPHAQHI